MANIVFYGAKWCSDCKDVKSFLNAYEQNYHYIDVEKNSEAATYVEKQNKGERLVPMLEIDGEVLTTPTIDQVVSKLGVKLEASKNFYDVAIIGAGPTGLTAAIYLQRDKFNTVILEKKNVGGNAFYTSVIENYPGFTNISGPELMMKMAEQAQTYGAKLDMGIDITSITKNNGYFHLSSNSKHYTARSVIIATGSTYRRLEVEGEDDMVGKSIHFCAACDGPFYDSKELVVIGSGNTALDESIFLSKMVKNIKLISNKTEFSASKTYVDKLPGIANIQTYMNKSTTGFTKTDEGKFAGVKIKDNATGEEELLTSDGAFVFVGMIPNTQFLGNSDINLDQRGFVVTEEDSARTNISGLFAAGDVRLGAIAQIAAATGEGVLASYNVKSFLKD